MSLINKNNRKIDDDIAIKVDNISKWFYIAKDRSNTIKSRFLNPFKKTETEKFTALENIDFEVKKGEFFGIIGRNGSGKSTLLKLVAGVFVPNEGRVISSGKLVPFLELGVGFNPELTGRENVYLNGTILGMSTKRVSEKFEEIFEFAEIREFSEVQLKHYSSGMMVRLAFAIAMQAEGDVYIMDEVLAVGDSMFQNKCIKKLEEIVAKGKTILFVSHDEVSIAKYCNRVLYIKDHKMEGIGNPIEILKMYKDDQVG
jgi:ABC-2 type transport system ATP-binding protein